jgi:carboxylesterase type B
MHVCCVFTIQAPLVGYQWGAGELVLAELMSSHWGNFATSGNPNSPVPVAANWPAVCVPKLQRCLVYTTDCVYHNCNCYHFTAANDIDMEYETPSSGVETNYVKTYCDFWDSLGYEWGN